MGHCISLDRAPVLGWVKGKGTIRCYSAEQGSHSFSILSAVVIKL